LKRAFLLLQGNGFLNDHDWDVLTDGIKELAVRADQSRFKHLRDGLASPISQFTCNELGIERTDQPRIRQVQILASFRAAK